MRKAFQLYDVFMVPTTEGEFDLKEDLGRMESSRHLNFLFNLQVNSNMFTLEKIFLFERIGIETKTNMYVYVCISFVKQ